MLDVDRSEQALDGEVLDADEPGCVELVPVIPSVRWMPNGAIATAAQAPQTRSLRRGSPADAQTAYGANRSPRHGTGFRTRQVV
jgi:hypothetical protein